MVALTADAIADVIFYTGGTWGHTLTASGAADYEVDPDLALEEQTVVVAQAALSHFFHEFRNLKTQERISDEGHAWEYTLSANLVQEQLKLLIAQRDRALELIGQRTGTATDQYVSFLQVRDSAIAAYIEPWVDGAGVGGGQDVDWRFDR